MAHPAGETDSGASRLDFDRRLKLEFYGANVTHGELFTGGGAVTTIDGWRKLGARGAVEERAISSIVQAAVVMRAMPFFGRKCAGIVEHGLS